MLHAQNSFQLELKHWVYVYIIKSFCDHDYLIKKYLYQHRNIPLDQLNDRKMQWMFSTLRQTADGDGSQKRRQ
jgi:hypothetical protein